MLLSLYHVTTRSYLGGIRWMPHSSPEDGLGGIFLFVSQLGYTVPLQTIG